MSLEKVIVFAEDAAAYEELCSGARFLGAQPTALYIGSEAGAKMIAAFGCRVLSFHKDSENLMLEDYTDALADVIRDEAPDLILMKISKRIQCIAGRLAIKLKLPVVNDALQLELDGSGVLFTRLVYGGAAKQIEKTSGAAIALVNSGVFEVTTVSAEGSVEILKASVEAGAIKRIGVQEKQEEVVDLVTADRIICVGRGVLSQDNISYAKLYADRIGAEVACTRPIAEGEGWLPRNRYLGVSGETVKPDVYFALGVSGQIQHMVGAGESKIIAAINKDKNAPIFKNCDYGLVADLEKVFPYLK